MNRRIEFRGRIRNILDGIDPEALSYREDEFWMIQSVYEYIDCYSVERELVNTAIALPLARGLHDGKYRKSKMMRGGESFRVPYMIHCLLVCRMLVDLHIDLPGEEEDILLASALCHDMIEDLDFPRGGRELYEIYHLDPRVYETVKHVSKRYDFTEQEEADFFHGIESDKLALLVKLSDRGHNVEDLYAMSFWKVHEYIGETRKFFLPMAQYGLAHYPEIRESLEILNDKLVCLTNAAEVLVDRFMAREEELNRQLEEIRTENDRLRREWGRVFYEEGE